HKEGYDQGLDQGRDQGYIEGRQSMLRMQLEERFGPLPAAIDQRVRAAGPEALEAWGRAVRRAPSLDDIFAACRPAALPCLASGAVSGVNPRRGGVEAARPARMAGAAGAAWAAMR